MSPCFWACVMPCGSGQVPRIHSARHFFVLATLEHWSEFCCFQFYRRSVPETVTVAHSDRLVRSM